LRRRHECRLDWYELRIYRIDGINRYYRINRDHRIYRIYREFSYGPVNDCCNRCCCR